MSYPRNRSAGQRAMAEWAYQRSKAAGGRPSLAELSERIAQAPRHADPRYPTSRGQLAPYVPKATPLTGEVQHHGGYVPRTPPRNRDGYGVRVAKARRYFGIASLFGFDAGSIIQGGLWSLLNQLPGFATPVANTAFVVPSVGNLPLYITWAVGPLSSDSQQGLAQANTRQTNQAWNPATQRIKQQTVGAGAYLSFYQGKVVNVGGIPTPRRDEMVTYGPAPVATVVRPSYVMPSLAGMPFPPQLPFKALPYRKPLLWPQSWDGGYGPPRVVTASPYKFELRLPPGKRRKEVKMRATRGLLGILGLIGAGTEALDAIGALHDALPEELQAKTKGLVRWKKEKMQAEAVYRHVNSIDWDTALFNLAWENVEDRAWGSLGIRGTGRYGGALGANKLLGDSHGQATSDALKEARERAKKIFEAATGLTIVS